MCYAKPGPRCSSHATQRYDKTSARLQSVLEGEVQPELDKLNKEREGVEGAKRATEADLPEKLQKKLKVARGRHREATRQFDATPAGVKHLDERVKDSAIRTNQANDACTSYMQLRYPGDTEDTVKEDLKKDENWTVLKQERTSSRAELTRVSNRRKYAEKYRQNDLAEYKAETGRKAGFKVMKRALVTNDFQSFKTAYTTIKNNPRPMNNISELQRRREPAITSPPVDKEQIPHAVSKRMVSANHSVNLSQGGTATVETRCYATEGHGGYVIEGQVNTTIHPESEKEKDPTTRKGFGSVKNGTETSSSSYQAPTNQVFSSLKDAESYIRENKKELSYRIASQGIHEETRRHDAMAMNAMVKRFKINNRVSAVA